MKKLLFALVILLVPSFALACRAQPVPGDQRLENIGKAYYVGVVKILDTVLVEPPAPKPGEDPADPELLVDMKVRLFSDYRKKESVPPRDIQIKQTLSSCDIYPHKKGAVFEAVIYEKKDGGFYFASSPMHFKPEEIEAYRKETPFPDEVADIKTKCESAGSVWSFAANGEPECKIPAPDSGKQCTISEECEGICLAQFSKEAIEKNFELILIDKEGIEAEKLEQKTGKCSQWINMTGCQYVFEGSLVKHICDRF
ncbi:MAG: hypothetical protein WBK55_07320 [Alphaproteobacteria bacterium]